MATKHVALGPIRAHVAARLYGRAAATRPAVAAPRRSAGVRARAAPVTTIGQVTRAFMVLAVGLTLAPTPRFDAAPRAPVDNAATE